MILSARHCTAKGDGADKRLVCFLRTYRMEPEGVVRLRRYAVREGCAVPQDRKTKKQIKGLAACRKGVAFPHSLAAKPLANEWRVLLTEVE